MGIEGATNVPREWGDPAAEAARVSGNMESPQSVGGATGEITAPGGGPLDKGRGDETPVESWRPPATGGKEVPDIGTLSDYMDTLSTPLFNHGSEVFDWMQPSRERSFTPEEQGDDFDERSWGRRFDPPWERNQLGQASEQPSNVTTPDIAGAIGAEQEVADDVVVGQGAVYAATDSESHREDVTAPEPERPSWFKGEARTSGVPRPTFIGIRDARPFNEQEATWLIADYLEIPPGVVSSLAQEMGESTRDIVLRWDGGPARDLPGSSVKRPPTAGQRFTVALDEYLHNAGELDPEGNAEL